MNNATHMFATDLPGVQNVINDTYSVNGHSGSNQLVQVKKRSSATLLLIECNTTVTELITAAMPACKIISTTNKEKGWQQIAKRPPDLILINMYLPAIDCYAYCNKLKENRQTSHIPVVLIINEADSANCAEEIVLSADDFLFEPYTLGELIVRIKKQLEEPKILKHPVNSTYPALLWEIVPATDLEPDHSFLKEVYATIEQQLNTSDFGVENIAHKLFMSRAKLHRKLTKLTGLAPGTLIKNYRLQRAVQFLKEGYNCTKTAYKVGFSSPAYFTKCFHEHYKITPINFLKQRL